MVNSTAYFYMLRLLFYMILYTDTLYITLISIDIMLLSNSTFLVVPYDICHVYFQCIKMDFYCNLELTICTEMYLKI